MKISHPVGKKRIAFHFFLGNITGADRASAVGKQDIKIASVVADVENRGILWNIFFADYSDLGAGFPENKFKDCLNNT